MHAERTVTLIVADATGPGTTRREGEDVEQQAVPSSVSLFHRSQDVPAAKLEAGLDKVQAEVDELLAKVKEPTVEGFHLRSVDVGLAISAEGSVGFASAGVQASITLSFERATNSDAARDR